MRKAITLGLIVAALATGDGKIADSSQDDVQYFNPNPQVQVAESGQSPEPVEYKNISYDALVDIVKQKGGNLEINLSTTDVGKDSETPLGNRGFGYAWANKANMKISLK